MTQAFYQNYKIGIIGGGQLGRMLIQSGIDLNLNFSVLDPDPQAPCHQLGQFTCGKLTDYQTVWDFGQNCDLLTIEIENVMPIPMRTCATIVMRPAMRFEMSCAFAEAFVAVTKSIRQVLPCHQRLEARISPD